MSLNLNDKLKLVEELIAANPDTTVRDFLFEVEDINKEIDSIAQNQ